MTVSLRPVKKKDWDYILKLRNKKEFREFFEHQHTISKNEHYAYLRRQEKNPNFFNQIICNDDKDVGYIRILDSDVSIIIDKKFHGRGIGQTALRLIEPKAKKLGFEKLIGRITVQNKPSRKIFEKNGYRLKMYWFEKKLVKKLI